MSRPTDESSVGASSADPHGQLTELVGRSWYENYIVRSHEECGKSVVLILYYHKDDAAKKVTFFQTGIIIAAGQTSCCIITSCVFLKDQLCEVQFCDETKWAVNHGRVHKETGMSIFFVYNVSMAKAKPAKFADSAIDSCEKVFTCGYSFLGEPTCGFSSSLNGRSFFSGSIISGVGMKNKAVEKATLFAHGCATGNNGQLGSAVFNERQNLVGMNVMYTWSSGYNYRRPTKVDGKDADLGGIVSALDLTSIRIGFASVWKFLEGKTLLEIVKFVTRLLLSEEDKPKGG